MPGNGCGDCDYSLLISLVTLFAACGFYEGCLRLIRKVFL